VLGSGSVRQDGDLGVRVRQLVLVTRLHREIPILRSEVKQRQRLLFPIQSNEIDHWRKN
jgi:hypothetical protein